MGRALNALARINNYQHPWLSLILTLAVLSAVLILHASINSVDISERFFWGDETVTYDVAKLPFLKGALALQPFHKQPPLFYWIAHIVMSFDDSPAALRGISFSFMVATLAFAILFIKELSLPSRLVLAMLLTLSPFAQYVSTEFRPYALATFFILTSSVYLYRALGERQSWGPTLTYGVFALGLQYSLTLNCWVFGCQMLGVGAFVLLQVREEGLRPALVASRHILTVSLLLSLGYLMFLIWLSRNDVLTIATHNFVDWTFGDRLADNYEKELYPKIILISHTWWFNWTIFGLFILGTTMARGRSIGVSAYLMTIFIGQMIFSTYMTYTRISFFDARYLTSSYVAFALLAAMGYEFLANRRWPGNTSLIPALALLVFIFPSSMTYPKRLPVTYLNPYKAAIDSFKCGEEQNLVFCSPGYSCTVPGYEYRKSDQVKVIGQLSLDQLPDIDSDSACILYIVSESRMARKATSEIGFVWLADTRANERETLAFFRRKTGYDEETIDLHMALPEYRPFLNDTRFPDYLHIFRPVREVDANKR